MLTTKTPWFFFLFGWIGLCSYWHVCRIKQLCPDSSPISTTHHSTAITSAPSIPELYIGDGQLASFHSTGHVAFAQSGETANVTRIQPLLDSLAAYLKANPDKKLELTGQYAPAEQNRSPEADLGMARAKHMRSYLEGLGVSPNQLAVKSAETIGLQMSTSGDSLYGGLQFAFLDELVVKGQRSTPAENLAKNEKFTSVFEPVNLYFNLGKSDFIKTADTDKFIEQAKAYLSDHPQHSLLITGHTDNTGSNRRNLELSSQRANAVKAELIKAGFPSAQLQTAGKGSAQPQASNETEAGRHTNRRATIVVKK